MPLKEQEYVITIAKYGSITKAAKELYISQPTLSVYINNLEKRLGTTLFHRIGKKFVLNLAGEIYVKNAKELINLQNRFEAELSDIISGYNGRIKVGIHQRRCSYLLPKLLPEFELLYPNIEVVLHQDSNKNLENLLREGEIDLFIGNVLQSKEGLNTIEIYKDKLLAVVSSANPLCKKGRWIKGQNYQWMDLKYLEKERFILQNKKQATRVFADNALEYAGIKPKKTLVMENMEAASRLAAEGYGVAFNVTSYAKHFTYTKPVSFFLVGDPDFEISIFVAYREGSYIPNYTQEFINLVKRHM